MSSEQANNNPGLCPIKEEYNIMILVLYKT